VTLNDDVLALEARIKFVEDRLASQVATTSEPSSAPVSQRDTRIPTSATDFDLKEAVFPGNNRKAIVAPAATDDISKGYLIGSIWIDTVTDLAYICEDNSFGAAVWQGIDVAATTTTPGIVELATTAEVTAGTDTTRVITPSSLPIQIQDSHYSYAADAQANDTYVITLVPAIAAYVTGQVFHFKANTANTGAATLNVNTRGAITIKKLNDQDLATGDIEAGQIVTVVYDGTNFQMQSQIATAAHDAITLAADADVLLGLTGQQLTFDTQTANTVLAGPASGAAADPTFRALVAADLTAASSPWLSLPY